MKREYLRWYSPRLDRDMEMLIFGHAGAKVLVFPTRDGRFYEYEDMRLIEAIAPKIEAGQLQCFCVDNLAAETFYCNWCRPAERIRRYIHYEDYLLLEVLPLLRKKNSHPCLITHGCSLGAFYAVNFAFRHPELVRKVAAFSGRYDLTLNVEHFSDLFDGFYNETIYLNTPSHFVPNLAEGEQLAALQRMDIVLVIGRDDPFASNNHELSQALWAKGIKHALHYWDGRAHRAYYWRRMAPLYI